MRFCLFFVGKYISFFLASNPYMETCGVTLPTFVKRVDDLLLEKCSGGLFYRQLNFVIHTRKFSTDGIADVNITASMITFLLTSA